MASASPRDAAFGPDPGEVPLIPADPLGRWLAAVALGGRGHYAAAWTVLARLLTDPAVPPAVAAHAGVTRASHLRQLGGHVAARRHDAHALRLVAASMRTGAVPVRSDRAEATSALPDRDGTGMVAARLDALIGLAADAVGVGDAAGARLLLDGIRKGVEEHHSWRLRVRWGWVRAEASLVQGNAGDAVAPAAAALVEATGGGSRRHVLKSRIVLGVARAAAGDVPADAVVGELAAIERECAERGLWPLCWPSALAAADLLDRGGERGCPAGDATSRRRAARHMLDAIYSRSDPVGKRQMG